MIYMNRLFVRISNRIYFAAERINAFRLRMTLGKCGREFYPSLSLKIKGGENIFIGDDFRCMGRDYLYANEGKITIGNHLRINTNVQIGSSHGEIVIGNDVQIGPNVVIRAADHELSRDILINRQGHIGGRVIIEDDVWIASNVVILKNVRLGKGCVVAAGAVVTKDVDSYTVVGGIPAKKISERV